jgi:hypothetical protein
VNYVVLNTNILLRLIKTLSKELDPTELPKKLIHQKIFCNCNLRVDVIIPQETFEELSRYVDAEILNEITTYIATKLMKMLAVGPMRLHKPTIVTFNKVLHRLGSSLREILSYIGNELHKTLKNLKEKADKVIVCISLLKTYECRSGNCVVYLLTMDRALHESIHDLLSKVGLATYLIAPSKVFDAYSINTCIYNECSVECLLREN